MKRYLYLVLTFGLLVAPMAATESAAGGRFTLITDAACISGTGFSQGFVWWTDKDPALAIFTFQPSGEVRSILIDRFTKTMDHTNMDGPIPNSTSVDIVLATRKGAPLASVYGVPCTPYP